MSKSKQSKKIQQYTYDEIQICKQAADWDAPYWGTGYRGFPHLFARNAIDNYVDKHLKKTGLLPSGAHRVQWFELRNNKLRASKSHHIVQFPNRKNIADVLRHPEYQQFLSKWNNIYGLGWPDENGAPLVGYLVPPSRKKSKSIQ